MSRYVRPALMGLVLVGMALAFALLLAQGVGNIADGGANTWFGVGLILLTVVGVWVVVVLVRNGFQLQRISARAAAEGFEVDTSGLARRPSGRIEPDSARTLFASVEREYEAEPHSWRVWYRLARAYDYAGDRARGREFMRRALEGEAAERRAGG